MLPSNYFFFLAHLVSMNLDENQQVISMSILCMKVIKYCVNISLDDKKICCDFDG